MYDIKEVSIYTNQLNILYVEDDTYLLEEMSEVLEDFFNSIDTAQNGAIALEKYEEYEKKNHQFYDLVITDLNMPVMDGMELIKEIHELNPKQTIMVVSAHNESDRLIKLIQSGINNFVLKPVQPEQLLQMLAVTCQNIYAQKVLQEYRVKLENMNSLLEARVEEQIKEIKKTQQLSIETIADMVENYDNETGTHVKRIEAYTSLLISNMQDDFKKYPKEEVEVVAFASLLHDVGKLMIPKDILNKPAMLNDDEREIMKKHSSLGADMLIKANNSFKKEFNKDSYFYVASIIARHHHERWDGQGYPDGLHKNDIPLYARVVAIADVYDALRSKRVYKDGFTHTKAVEIIKSEREKAFDPKIVDIFLELNKEFEEIFDRLG